MIMSRTPLRISFAGGGTDVKEFFEKEPGMIVNTAINKYVYIAVHKSFDGKILLKYSKTEHVSDPNEIEHPLFREALRHTEVTGVEITSIADIPSQGSGLGSSSSFLVGLLHALYAYRNMYVTPKILAQEAAYIERTLLREAGGYQDQYAAAYGGLEFMQFLEDGSVTVDPIICSYETRKHLQKRLLMFYTGISRSSHEVQKHLHKNAIDKYYQLKRMKELAVEIKKALERGHLKTFGELLHEGWLHKKKLSTMVSNDKIDVLYDKAMKAGASGGRLNGAGSGGFLLFYVEEHKQAAVREALSDLQELEFKFDQEGSKIIHISDQ